MARPQSTIRFFVVIAVLSVTAGCDFPHSIRAPAITQELPYDGDGNTAFDRKVKSRFPIGSDEGAMHSELAREGFTIHQINQADGGSPHGFEASAITNDGICDLTWTIDWASQDGKLTYVMGKSTGTCN